MQHIASSQQHELLKQVSLLYLEPRVSLFLSNFILRTQIRLLIVAYDNMDDNAKESLASSAEILANLDVLIEIGQACLNYEVQRRRDAPRPLRPAIFGPPNYDTSLRSSDILSYSAMTLSSLANNNNARTRKPLKQQVVLDAERIAKTKQNATQERLARAQSEIAALSEGFMVPSYLRKEESTKKITKQGSKMKKKKEKYRPRGVLGSNRAPWM